MEKYEISKKQIGKGKYGEVYLSRIKSTKEIIALKIISKLHIKASQMEHQIDNEIKILKLISHDNIIRYIDTCENEVAICIVTNYIQGSNLYDILKKGKIDESIVSKYILQLTKAVIYLHSLYIIHRDIKPENIILSEDNQIILCDFGWSVISDSLETKYNDLCGTLDYLCPEIVKYKEYDYRCDIWNIGVLTYELLLGKAPFYGPTYRITYSNISNLRYTIPENISENARDFISKILVYEDSRISIDTMLKHPFLS